MYRFQKDETEKEKWIKAVPNANLRVSKDTVVCALRWPSGFEEIKVNGKSLPKDQPLIWPGVPSSQVPTSSPPPRSTKKTCSSTRSIKEDQISEFLSSDKGTFTSLKENLKNQREYLVHLSCVIIEDTLYVLSQQHLNGVPLFLVKIFIDLNFETYHCGIKCTTSTLSKNRVMTVHAWSVFEVIIRYLPPIKTLTRITLKASTLMETCFIRSVFNTVKENQKQCVIMLDEIYVKKVLLSHGGALFERATDDPQSLEKTLLGVMISCMFDEPTFISKMLPIAKLNSSFLYEQIRLTTDAINQSSGVVKAVICDGNRNKLFSDCLKQNHSNHG